MAMTDDVLELVSTVLTQNAYGVWVKTETSRQVFCRVSSVSQTEFFEAGRNGLNPEWRFSIFAADYQDEETVIYNGKRYGIYRTYRDGDWIELYAERKGGVNKSATTSTATTSTVTTSTVTTNGEENTD